MGPSPSVQHPSHGLYSSAFSNTLTFTSVAVAAFDDGVRLQEKEAAAPSAGGLGNGKATFSLFPLVSL